MQIQSTNPLAGAAAAGAPASGTTATNAVSAPSESTFLQLLVAQLKHQDPTSPQDPTQFVSELAQFSELESVLNIQKDTDALAKNSNPGGTTAPATIPAAPVTNPGTQSTKAGTAA